MMHPARSAIERESARASILDKNVAAAVPADLERQFTRPPQRLPDCSVAPRWGDQQDKTAAAGSEQLATQGPSAAGNCVPLIDLVVRNSASE